MELTAVSASMLRAVFASDQDMYPAPLTLDRLQSWVTACPSLSVCFRTSHPTTSRDDKDKMDSTPPLGVVIVCPLRRVVWEDLLAGRLREPDIDAASMFPSDDTDGGVGLHVFHIERLVPPAVFAQASGAGRSGGFAECAMEAVRAAAGQRLGWHVIGYSALTATPEGKAAFRRMDFASTGHQERFPHATLEMMARGHNTPFVDGQGEHARGVPCG